MRYFIGVDVGGTTTTLAIGNDRREILAVAEQVPTRSEQGPQGVIRAIVEAGVALVGKMGGTIADVVAAGLATPGPASLDGQLHNSPNLKHPDWNGCPIRGRLQEAFRVLNPNLHVRYIGDGQAAALGEFSIRSRKFSWKQIPGSQLPDQVPRSLFMLIVGTGLGGGAVIDGRAVQGARGRAGHGGHVSLPPDAFRYEHDRQLLVGNAYSSAESAISLTALTHQLGYRLGLEQWRGHPLNSAPGSIRDKAKRLRDLAGDGDALANELFDDQARALGIALLDANYIGDYDLLVIGGGVSDLSAAVRGRYLQLVIESYRAHALDGFKDGVSFEFSICGDDAPVIGAVAWAATDAV